MYVMYVYIYSRYGRPIPCTHTLSLSHSHSLSLSLSHVCQQVYVPLYVCMYVYMYVCMYVCMCVCVCFLSVHRERGCRSLCSVCVKGVQSHVGSVRRLGSLRRILQRSFFKFHGFIEAYVMSGRERGMRHVREREREREREVDRRSGDRFRLGRRLKRCTRFKGIKTGERDDLPGLMVRYFINDCINKDKREQVTSFSFFFLFFFLSFSLSQSISQTFL